MNSAKLVFFLNNQIFLQKQRLVQIAGWFDGTFSLGVFLKRQTVQGSAQHIPRNAEIFSGNPPKMQQHIVEINTTMRQKTSISRKGRTKHCVISHLDAPLQKGFCTKRVQTAIRILQVWWRRRICRRVRRRSYRRRRIRRRSWRWNQRRSWRGGRRVSGWCSNNTSGISFLQKRQIKMMRREA